MRLTHGTHLIRRLERTRPASTTQTNTPVVSISGHHSYSTLDLNSRARTLRKITCKFPENAPATASYIIRFLSSCSIYYLPQLRHTASTMSLSSRNAQMKETSTIKPRQTMRGHTDTVWDVAHLPSRRQIITC